jgi:hypothetical protein
MELELKLTTPQQTMKENENWVPRRQKQLISGSITLILLNNRLIRAYHAVIKNPLHICANNL